MLKYNDNLWYVQIDKYWNTMLMTVICTNIKINNDKLWYVQILKYNTMINCDMHKYWNTMIILLYIQLFEYNDKKNDHQNHGE